MAQTMTVKKAMIKAAELPVALVTADENFSKKPFDTELAEAGCCVSISSIVYNYD